MGRTYVFECCKCGYKATVSGRADRGFRFAVQTILCHDCRTLHDAVTRLRIAAEPPASLMPRFKTIRPRGPKVASRPPTFDAALNQLPLPGAKRSRWIHFKPQCPVSPFHKFEAWNDPGLCPQCGFHLEKNAVPFRLWD